uniref:Uncharacterized protein n=1 Tax=Panthera leo TaxID=9689 RepID=A0A8C9D384_PANLE
MGQTSRKRAGEMVEVLPIRRYKAHLVPEDGSLACLKAGIYVLRFDNTYSLVHSKHINSTVEVLLTDQTFVKKTERSWANLVAPTVRPTDLERIAVEKIIYYSQFPRGGDGDAKPQRATWRNRQMEETSGFLMR